MRSLSLVRNACALLALTCLALAPAAHAQNLTYLLTGNGSGTITVGGSATPFLNADFSFTETAPVSGIVPAFGGFQYNPAGTVTFTLGSNASTLANFGVVLGNVPPISSEVGFVDSTGNMGVIGATLTDGPLTLSSPQSPVVLPITQSAPITTSFGTVAFTTITNETFSSVPEPGSLALLAGMTLSGASAKY